MATEAALLRHDLEAGTSTERSFGAGSELGEAVFVPRSDDAGEAEGWLLAFVYSATTDTSALHIVNADDFTGEPQAVVQLPQRVPAGFHGNWVPDRP
jgi:carotenoid cleavage dioxygenase